MALTNREWKAALNMYGPVGRIGASFIDADGDMDDKKYVEKTNYSSFNPSAGSKSGVAGSKNVEKSLIDKDPNWLVDISEKITPVLKQADVIMAGIAGTAIGGPQAGQVASSAMGTAQEEKAEPEQSNIEIDTGLDGLNLWSDNLNETGRTRETGQPVPEKIEPLGIRTGISNVKMNLRDTNMDNLVNPYYNYIPKY